MIFRRKKKPKAPWVKCFPDQARKLRPSQKRGNDAVLYRADSREFLASLRLAGYTCPVMAKFDQLSPEFQAELIVPWTGNRRSNKISETHHRFGRVRGLLRWQAGWAGLSRFGHRAVHQFPEEARRHGWLAQVGWWNNERIMDEENSHLTTKITYPKK